jgi:hypothetical protein
MYLQTIITQKSMVSLYNNFHVLNDIGGYISLTYSVVSEVVKLFHQNLFENIQISDQNVGLLTDIKSTL